MIANSCRMDNLTQQEILSPVEIRILNYTNGEIVDYPFVLLDCEITRKEGEPSTTNEVLDISASAAIKHGTFSHGQDSVLVETQTGCRSWPTIHGGFKSLVRLCVGENVIKIKASTIGSLTERDFKLTYNPSTLKRFVRVVYIKCSDSDGSFEAPPGVSNNVDAATKRLAFNARLLQTFTAQDLYQHGFGHRTFRLEEDDEGNPLINVFTSSLTTDEALKMTGGQLYDKFYSELSKSELHDPLCKFWAFMSCTHYDPPPPGEFNDRDIHLYVKAHTALGGGQLALFGTGGLHAWASSIDELIPCFTNTKMIDRRSLFDDSSRRGSYWANYATGLGASMHELGHCFDLAHTPAGIMGRGFDDFNCVFSLWKNPPPLHNMIGTTCEDNSSKNDVRDIPVSTTVETFIDTNKDNIHETKAPIATKGMAVAEKDQQSVSDELQHPQEIPSALVQSLDKQAVDWMKNSTNLSRPGDWSHGAKWYRSSAVILRYHSWFSDAEESDLTSNQPVVHWNNSTYGPVGKMSGEYGCNKTYFNHRTWLEQHQAILCGFVIHAGTYVNSIQIIGRVVRTENGVENVEDIYSDPHGRITGRKYVFKLDEPDEYITALDVRAGAWIDSIRIHTNYKSSVMMGGMGGCLNHFQPPEGQSIVGMFGCAGNFVGSLAILLESPEDSIADPQVNADLIIYASNGIRLIEYHNEKHCEVCKHWEFLQPTPPKSFALNRHEIVSQKVRILVQDNLGNIRSFGPFCDLHKIFTSPAHVTSKEEDQSCEDGDENEQKGIEEKKIKEKAEKTSECSKEEIKKRDKEILGDTEQESITLSNAVSAEMKSSVPCHITKDNGNLQSKEEEITASKDTAQQDSGDRKTDAASLTLRYY